VLGDLNETLTMHDRQPQSASAAASPAAPIAHLRDDGFTDVYRHLNPDALLAPGFTHFIDGVRPSRSRIDYIWSKGVPAASLLRARIDAALAALSHHRLLWADIQLHNAAAFACTPPLLRLRLPDLRRASDAHRKDFVAHVEASLLHHRTELEEFAASSCHTDTVLHDFASCLADLVRQSASATLPMTGGQPGQSGHLLRLRQQRRILARLLHVADDVVRSCRPDEADCLFRCPEWLRLYRQ
jgi:hypothetical protein